MENELKALLKDAMEWNWIDFLEQLEEDGPETTEIELPALFALYTRIKEIVC